MRRAQSVRHYSRPSLALASDDLGVLREPGESDEDVLRKQLIEKDRLVDQLNEQIESLQFQLKQRPPKEEIDELKKEHKNLDLLLQGTQRENERAMSDLEKVKAREKLLESKLRELAGENWQSSLDIPPPLNLGVRGMGMLGHQRSATLGSGSPFAGNSSFAGNSPFTGNSSFAGGSSFPSDTSFDSMSTPTPHTPPPRASRSSSQPYSQSQPQGQQQQRQEALAAKLEQVKLLVLGMDQRLKVRERVLAKSVERAESSLRSVEKVTRESGKDA